MTSTVTSTFVAADGDGYERQMGRWSRRLAPLFIAFAGIRGGRRVLDVGCGTGSLSSCLAGNPEIESVQGLDFSPVYIEHAMHRSRDPRLTFQVGDACTLPFPDATYDHSLSMLALQFIPQAQRAVHEMRRVTRRGGTVRPQRGIREGDSLRSAWCSTRPRCLIRVGTNVVRAPIPDP